MDAADFQLPPDAPADLAAVAQLAASLATLTAAVETLHEQYQSLADAVARQQAGPRRAPASVPWPLRWDDLDRDAAAQTWAWLIDWVSWMTDRYQLAEELPACWYRHPPLVEELTALGAAWQVSYDDTATADGPLLWHERFGRARDRLRAWDDYTRCRHGEHHDRHIDLGWPADWRDDAVDAANHDLTGRPSRPDAEPASRTEPRR
ncbi:hypothetical protein [Actinoplanes sp. NPDC026619]|uniref:hypothetical protein n=1 Tax=Actinoplanes sp. NPDC026619 TaxID=3155798 RepID=UPI0033C9F45B